MVIQVVEFSGGGYKIRRFLPKNQNTPRKLLNLENWCSGKLSKFGHHFSNNEILKLILSKHTNNKNYPKWVVFNEKEN